MSCQENPSIENPSIAQTNEVAARHLRLAPAGLAGIIRRLHSIEAAGGVAQLTPRSQREQERIWRELKAVGISAGVERYRVSGPWGSLVGGLTSRRRYDVSFCYTSQTREVWESR